MNKPALTFFMCLGLCSASLSAQEAKPSPAAQLQQLADSYIESTFELNPIQGTYVGEARFADKFVNNLTPQFRERQRRYAGSLEKNRG
jgi:hypothetical protein